MHETYDSADFSETIRCMDGSHIPQYLLIESSLFMFAKRQRLKTRFALPQSPVLLHPLFRRFFILQLQFLLLGAQFHPGAGAEDIAPTTYKNCRVLK